MDSDKKFYKVCYIDEYKDKFCPGSEFYYGYDGVSSSPSISYFKRSGSDFIFATWDYKRGTDACIDNALNNAAPVDIAAAVRNAAADSTALTAAIEAAKVASNKAAASIAAV